MGESTYVKTTSRISAQPTKGPKPLKLHIDVPLLLVVIALVIFGLLMVYSASWNYVLRNNQPASYVVFSQIRWVIVGALLTVVLSQIDYHIYKKIAVIIMLITLAMLTVVLFTDISPAVPTRTLLGGSVQPSELAKLAIVIYLSVWIHAKKDKLNNITFGLVPMMFILGCTGGLILLQPDISAAATIVILGGLLFFLGDVDIRQIILVVFLAVGVGFAVVTLIPTGQARIASYVSGLEDPVQASYHVQRAMEAVVRGGFFGVGIGKGTTKFTGLPVPWTDSIFAVIAEETGLFGAFIVIGLYLILLWRGLMIAQKAPDLLGRLLASGMTLWILVEAVINIGVMVNLLPFAGNALPLISAGGSSMTMTLAGIGITMSVGRYTAIHYNSRKGMSINAVVNLRRRDGRRSVSGNVRLASNRKKRRTSALGGQPERD